jgi:hypothetical protein
VTSRYAQLHPVVTEFDFASHPDLGFCPWQQARKTATARPSFDESEKPSFYEGCVIAFIVLLATPTRSHLLKPETLMAVFKDTIMIKGRPYDRAVEVTVTYPDGMNVTNVQELAERAWHAPGKAITVGRVTVNWWRPRQVG